MSFDSIAPSVNGRATANGDVEGALRKWDQNLKNGKNRDKQYDKFHGDRLLGDKRVKWVGMGDDLRRIFTIKNIPSIIRIFADKVRGKELDVNAAAQLIGSLSDYSKSREAFMETKVKAKYDAMLHPPLTYLGDAFQFRTVDGKFNSVLHPQLGMAGTPYARTVPSKTPPLGALPDPTDIFEKLMARDEGRQSQSGLSSLLVYNATIIIHDIFRTNYADKNLSDTSSYLDLSPLYGYTEEMQRQIRDEKFGCGLLKPDTFAEDRLLRQPPGVCIMLVMYNRYHNYAASMLKQINENGRFSIPQKFQQTKWLAVAEDEKCVPTDKRTSEYAEAVETYAAAWRKWEKQGRRKLDSDDRSFENAETDFQIFLTEIGDANTIHHFVEAYDAAYKKLDDDLFQTARLITCGLYININIHDYLRALMGFHQYNSNFTLEPRTAMNHRNVSRGLGNQVTVEFNLMYRFHCAISRRDEEYVENLIKAETGLDPKKMSMKQFFDLRAAMSREPIDPWLVEFGLPKEFNREKHFSRNRITGLFDDQQMITELCRAMEDPISNFGPRNVPRCLKNVEILGILQARKWEVGTLNDFRDFFGMSRHEHFESITKNREIQDALRDLYDHPDKVELYPGIFAESDAGMNVDPGPSGIDSALWVAIFSDAISLVRSDRFYTVDWNTNSLTSWGMKEVTPDNEILKSSVFHRLLQRAFPDWFPYDSIRFFHPFYTVDKNRQYAVEQGYADTFKMTKIKGTAGAYDTTPSDPKKPKKPIYLTEYDEIKELLAKSASEIVHPAFADIANLPPKVVDALKALPTFANGTDQLSKMIGAPEPPPWKYETKHTDTNELKEKVQAYFELQMRRIVERDVIHMGRIEDSETGRDADIFQLDVTRDLAIPVVTRCIADFLGFGSQIKDTDNPNAPYTENEIYEHITNCQTFLAFNVDETKLLKRRTEFKNSMQFLLKLTEEQGNVLEVSRYPISKTLRSLGQHIARMIRRSITSDEKFVMDPMKTFGREVAERIYGEVKDTGKAAAILLLTALDIAHVAVLVFTATLEHLLQGAYDEAREKVGYEKAKCKWFQIQKWALQEDSNEQIENAIQEAQRLSIRLPFIRKVVKEDVTLEVDGRNQSLKKGRIIICEIYKAMNSDAGSKRLHLIYASSLTTSLIGFNPKDIAVYGLTAMIKVMAQMKDLRRGHTSQGLVKKIEIDQAYEGYGHYMAPERMQMIECDADRAQREFDCYQKRYPGSDGQDEMRGFLKQRVAEAEDNTFTATVLKPESVTYLSPSWDELIPFPTTWKLRFEGYGPSTYGKNLEKLYPEEIQDDTPPWYQASGPSHVGGGFAAGAGKAPHVKDTPAGQVGAALSGCGAPLALVSAAPKALGKVVSEGTHGAGQYAGAKSRA